MAYDDKGVVHLGADGLGYIATVQCTPEEARNMMQRLSRIDPKDVERFFDMDSPEHLSELDRKIRKLEQQQAEGDSSRLTMLRLNSLRVLRHRLERGV